MEASIVQPDDKCLTLHQPWASLLVYGVKRIEGRGWKTLHRGKLPAQEPAIIACALCAFRLPVQSVRGAVQSMPAEVCAVLLTRFDGTGTLWIHAAKKRVNPSFVQASCKFSLRLA